MDPDTSIKISRKAFFQSAVILLTLMLLAGVLTRIVPAGRYSRSLLDGREVIEPDSFTPIERPDFPAWRWLTAPFEVLGGPDGQTIIVIALFVLFVAVSFGILDRVGIVRAMISAVVDRYKHKKYLLLGLMTFLYMLLGATFGIFEEIVPLVPLMVALSYSLGWDALVGLGMSILAVNMGFSAALANPFTIGVAQRIAGLPLFSGILFRIPIFLILYGVLTFFLIRYARRIEADPQRSLVYDQDLAQGQGALHRQGSETEPVHLRRSVIGFSVFLVLIILTLLLGSQLASVADYILPIVGILFLLGGISAGVMSGSRLLMVVKAAWEGALGILPALPLIMMAASIKFIVQQGLILDTILHTAAEALHSTAPMISILLMLFVTLVLEIFITSGSAKAFLMMPILIPLADLAGLSRQATVLAYSFGDGFSNLAYPTNPVLLITLGLTVVSYPKWMRWTAPLWMAVMVVSVLALMIAVAIGYGPF